MDFLEGEIKSEGLLRVYFNDRLNYEGEYLNGERNCKGKEYHDNGDLIFESEYLNGQRWNGKGKGYNDHGGLEFIGEYFNGKKNGEGKEYNNYHNIP